MDFGSTALASLPDGRPDGVKSKEKGTQDVEIQNSLYIHTGSYQRWRMSPRLASA